MPDPHDQADAPDQGASPRRTTAGRRGRRRVDTRDPRRSRERALKVLFQADVRGEAANVLLARIVDDPRAWAMLDDLDPEESADLAAPVDAADAEADAEPHLVELEARRRKALELDGFTRSLVQGVADHQADLDELIQRFARRWTVGRMPAIDRNLLRLGTYELMHEVTSPAVVINEVIELAKRLSTEDSGRYVNGVLEAVRKHLAKDRAAAGGVANAAAEPEVEPVVPDTTEAPPFEPDVTVGALDEVAPEAPFDDGVPEVPLDDVLPPPDAEGDAVDLPADLTAPDDGEPDSEAEGTDDASDGDGGDDGVSGQQQLF